MDSRNLAMFRHLALSLHFGKTAEAMYVSPSTLSRAIQRLEEECGADLFIRDNRTVKLTAIGRQVLEFSEQFLSAWQLLKESIDEHNQALRGELSLFCSVTASVSHLPQLLDGFRSSYPQVEIKLITGDPGESAKKVLEQITDVAIAIHTPDFPKELSFRTLDTVPLVLIAPANLKLAHVSEINWHEHQVILPETGPSKRIVHHWFTEHGIRPHVYAHVAGNEAIVSMVALGCGLGIVPRIVIKNSVISDKISILEIRDIESYQLGLCCLKKREDEPAIKAFMQQN